MAAGSTSPTRRVPIPYSTVQDGPRLPGNGQAWGGPGRGGDAVRRRRGEEAAWPVQAGTGGDRAGAGDAGAAWRCGPGRGGWVPVVGAGVCGSGSAGLGRRLPAARSRRWRAGGDVAEGSFCALSSAPVSGVLRSTPHPAPGNALAPGRGSSLGLLAVRRPAGLLPGRLAVLVDLPAAPRPAAAHTASGPAPATRRVPPPPAASGLAGLTLEGSGRQERCRVLRGLLAPRLLRRRSSRAFPPDLLGVHRRGHQRGLRAVVSCGDVI